MEKYKYSGDGAGIYIYIVLGLFVNFLYTPTGYFLLLLTWVFGSACAQLD
jgi:hypothetical protein